MRYTRAAGAVLAIGAALVPAATASGETAALKSADAPVGQLEKASTHTPTAGSSVTHYDQVVGGVPVSGADVVVSDLAGSAPEVLFDKSVSGLEDPGAPSVSRGQALAAALAAIGSPSGGHRSAELVIDATRGNQLAWQVSYYDSRPISDWLVTVSATSGDVIGKDDQLLRAEGSANLFDPNPVVSEDGYEGLRDREDRDSANLTDARVPVTLEDLKDDQDCLKGDWATATFNPTAKKVCKDIPELGQHQAREQPLRGADGLPPRDRGPAVHPDPRPGPDQRGAPEPDRQLVLSRQLLLLGRRR